MNTSDFDYNLPPELIAQRPAGCRDASRMMALNRRTGECRIVPFTDIKEFLSPGDLLVFNDTKVLHCRMYGYKEGRQDGAKFEMLLLESADTAHTVWKCLLRPGKRALPGTKIFLAERDGSLNKDGDYVEITGRDNDGFLVRFPVRDADYMQKRYGHMPLPPYIRRSDEDNDVRRYQTVFAREDGAVAAPTAGLHFSDDVLRSLDEKGVKRAGVTLHVGIGTFRPVSAEHLEEHRMHSERFVLPEATAEAVNSTRQNGSKVLAVGTTVVRTLESCADEAGMVHPGSGRTEIFLYPPYRIKSADMLLTNFHLPQSTLLMLVSCLIDREMLLAAYQKAIAEKMRFFSYGDCMLLY